MTFTSYPFDNQDTTEGQYSALAGEWQDSGVIGSYGDTTLQVTANSSAMAVFLSPGSAIVRGFFVNNDASYRIDVNAAGAAIRYDAIILRLDPSQNSIVPVYVPNAGLAPTLTRTATGIYEILLALITVQPGDVTVAAGRVTDLRHFAGRRLRVTPTSNRPANPRPWDINIAADKGGRLEKYDPASSAWVSRESVFWGSGAAFPTTGVQEGDTFKHSQMGLCVYDGAAWIPQTPYMAKLWSVNSFSGALALNTIYQPIALNAGRASSGFTLNLTNAQVNGQSAYSMALPLDGLYDVRYKSYISGGGGSTVSTWAVRHRTGTSDYNLQQIWDFKNDTSDRTGASSDTYPLKAGDHLWLACQMSAGSGANYFGNGEAFGIMLQARWIGPLNGATPV